MPPTYASKDFTEDADAPSSHLWVGNLAADVTDSELTNLFGKYGELDSITSYTSRSFSFVYFKRFNDAKAAKDALQGTFLHGNFLKIEFAKPAKPSKRLWIGGVGPSISKEELEKEFLKFGKIEDLKFLRDRSTAFIDYSRLEDASHALKSMNGKLFGSDQIRVDFLRSQPLRREQWAEIRDVREGQPFNRGMVVQGSPWMPQDSLNYSEPCHVGSKRQLHPQLTGVNIGDGEPSNVLCICYPPSVHIDEQMLHNAMILYGEIESIKCFPERHCSFVEFRSVDEAQLAREKLQGRLFNDPRITVLFSGSEHASGKGSSGIYPGIKGPIPDMFLNEPQYQPVSLDIFGSNRATVPNSISGSLPLRGVPNPHMLTRPVGSQGSFEPLLSGSDYSDLATFNKIEDSNPKTLVGGPNWRSSPGPSMLSSIPSDMKSSNKSASASWDVFDANSLQRESKRSRIDNSLPIYDSSFPLKGGLDQLNGIGPHGDEDALGPFANVRGENRQSPVVGRLNSGGIGRGHLNHDYIWRGVISKGGTPICHARCIPVGEGFNSEIPEVVNCSARTGLDLLTKHYADALGFSIVFFLPDSEDDFASYTEFLRYLGAKNRAGVAKFNDGTTLFLVPPSDFLTDVLNVSGPERLYGVVLKFQENAPSSTSVPTQSLHPQYLHRQHIPPPPRVYGGVVPEEKVLQGEFSIPVNSKHLLRPGVSQASEPTHAPSVAPFTTPVVPQSGVSLTPELIATLASLLPGTGKSSGLESTQSSMGTSMVRSFANTAGLPDQGLRQEWNHVHQAPELTGYSMQQTGQFNSQGQLLLPQHDTYPSISNTPSHSTASGGSQIQDRLTANFTSPSQGGQFTAPQVDQNYQHEIPDDTLKGYGMAHGSDAFGMYDSLNQQSKNFVAFSNQTHGSDISQPQSVLPMPSEQTNVEHPNQLQHLQSAMYGPGQGTPDVEADKNLRYQSTLQFAANLLFQIQQQQQQPGSQSGQGSTNP